VCVNMCRRIACYLHPFAAVLVLSHSLSPFSPPPVIGKVLTLRVSSCTTLLSPRTSMCPSPPLNHLFFQLPQYRRNTFYVYIVHSTYYVFSFSVFLVSSLSFVLFPDQTVGLPRNLHMFY